MQNKVFSFYTELPGWAKGVVIIGGAAAVYFTAKSFIARIKKDAATKNSRATVANTKTDLQKLLTQGQKLSYPTSKYNALSSVLLAAFNGWTTDENQVYGVFKQMKNMVDVLQLIVTYDVRTIVGGWMQNDEVADLPGAIAIEMDSYEIDEINTILKKNKIDYQFGGGL